MTSNLDAAMPLTAAFRLAALTDLGLASAVESERKKVARWLDHWFARVENRVVERVLLNRIKASFSQLSDPAAVAGQLQHYRHAYSSGAMSTLGMSSAPAFALEPAASAPANAAWVCDPADSNGVILYTPGGGFILPASTAQVSCAQRLGEASGCSVLLNQHAMAPESPFPIPIEETVALVRWVEQQFPDKKIMMAADTAGASVSLGALLQMRDSGDALPAGLLLFSPWADLSMSGWSYITKSATADSPFRMETAAFCAKIYLQEAEATNPLASAIYADLDGLPPLSIHTSQYDMHFDDALKLVENADAAHVPANVNYWDSPRHHLERFNSKEAKKSLELAAQFVKARLGAEQSGQR